MLDRNHNLQEVCHSIFLHSQVERKDNKYLLDKGRIDLAGNQANIDGHINLVDRYAGSKLNFDLYTKNAGELGRMFGKDGLPDQPMKLTATVKPAPTAANSRLLRPR